MQCIYNLLGNTVWQCINDYSYSQVLSDRLLGHFTVVTEFLSRINKYLPFLIKGVSEDRGREGEGKRENLKEAPRSMQSPM